MSLGPFQPADYARFARPGTNTIFFRRALYFDDYNLWEVVGVELAPGASLFNFLQNNEYSREFIVETYAVPHEKPAVSD